jgi:uncharacterized Zn finger protein (UPF0148 family)
MPLGIFGLDGAAGLIASLVILFLIVVYLALIWWTYLDARRRIEDPVLIACATCASVFPYLGTVVYTILRPPEYLEDREERELELRAAELELRQRIEQSCPHCEYPVERSYLRCPNCERRLRNPCRKYHKPLDPRWGICPYCETEVRKQRPERETRRTDRQRTARAAGQRAAGQRSSSSSRSDGPNRRTERPPVASRNPQRPSSSSR